MFFLTSAAVFELQKQRLLPTDLLFNFNQVFFWYLRTELNELWLFQGEQASGERARGRIEGANEPGGEQARGRTGKGAKSQTPIERWCNDIFCSTRRVQFTGEI